MSRKIFVVYPEQGEEEEEKGKTKLFAKIKWSRTELDLTQVEADLENLILMFESLGKKSAKYSVDEAKLTVGFVKAEKGKLQATISASLINLVKGSVGGEISQDIKENRLFEIKIKRNP
jgi:hypothetical protein